MSHYIMVMMMMMMIIIIIDINIIITIIRTKPRPTPPHPAAPCFSLLARAVACDAQELGTTSGSGSAVARGERRARRQTRQTRRFTLESVWGKQEGWVDETMPTGPRRPGVQRPLARPGAGAVARLGPKIRGAFSESGILLLLLLLLLLVSSSSLLLQP